MVTPPSKNAQILQLYRAQRAREGFLLLFERFKPSLLTLANQRLWGYRVGALRSHDAEDIVHLALLRTHRALIKLEEWRESPEALPSYVHANFCSTFKDLSRGKSGHELLFDHHTGVSHPHEEDAGSAWLEQLQQPEHLSIAIDGKYTPGLEPILQLDIVLRSSPERCLELARLRSAFIDCLQHVTNDTYRFSLKLSLIGFTSMQIGQELNRLAQESAGSKFETYSVEGGRCDGAASACRRAWAQLHRCLVRKGFTVPEEKE